MYFTLAEIQYVDELFTGQLILPELGLHLEDTWFISSPGPTETYMSNQVKCKVVSMPD
jgi:hypothetical protein